MNANTKGQWLRQEGKFADAREQLTMCAAAACPGMVRDDCVQRLDELERSQPSIVFDVTDPAGNDLSAVTVTIDGRPLRDKLDGTAIEADAGTHGFTFRVAGQPPVAREFLLTEGEKARHEHIVIGTLTIALPATAPSASGGGAHRALAYVAFGVGAAGVIVGGVYGILALGTKGRLDEACQTKQTCPGSSQSDIDAINTQSAISTIGFGVGIVGMVAGAVTVWTSHGDDRRATAVESPPRRRLSPWVGANVVGLAGCFE